MTAAPAVKGGRGGLPDRMDDFRGLMGEAWEDSVVRSRLESCLAVMPMYLLAREPAEILDCASIDASADETLRWRASVGEAIDGVSLPWEEATDAARRIDGGPISIGAIFVDATNTPHFGGHEKYETLCGSSRPVQIQIHVTYPAAEPSFFPLPANLPLSSTPAHCPGFPVISPRKRNVPSRARDSILTGSPTSKGRCEARLESRVNASDMRLSERDVTVDRGVDPILTAELGLYALLCLLGGVTGTVCSP